MKRYEKIWRLIGDEHDACVCGKDACVCACPHDVGAPHEVSRGIDVRRAWIAKALRAICGVRAESASSASAKPERLDLEHFLLHAETLLNGNDDGSLQPLGKASAFGTGAAELFARFVQPWQSLALASSKSANKTLDVLTIQTILCLDGLTPPELGRAANSCSSEVSEGRQWDPCTNAFLVLLFLSLRHWRLDAPEKEHKTSRPRSLGARIASDRDCELQTKTENGSETDVESEKANEWLAQRIQLFVSSAFSDCVTTLSMRDASRTFAGLSVILAVVCFARFSSALPPPQPSRPPPPPRLLHFLLHSSALPTSSNSQSEPFRSQGTHALPGSMPGPQMLFDGIFCRVMDLLTNETYGLHPLTATLEISEEAAALLRCCGSALDAIEGVARPQSSRGKMPAFGELHRTRLRPLRGHASDAPAFSMARNTCFMAAVLNVFFLLPGLLSPLTMALKNDRSSGNFSTTILPVYSSTLPLHPMNKLANTNTDIKRAIKDQEMPATAPVSEESKFAIEFVKALVALQLSDRRILNLQKLRSHCPIGTPPSQEDASELFTYVVNFFAEQSDQLRATFEYRTATVIYCRSCGRRHTISDSSRNLLLSMDADDGAVDAADGEGRGAADLGPGSPAASAASVTPGAGVSVSPTGAFLDQASAEARGTVSGDSESSAPDLQSRSSSLTTRESFASSDVSTQLDDSSRSEREWEDLASDDETGMDGRTGDSRIGNLLAADYDDGDGDGGGPANSRNDGESISVTMLRSGLLHAGLCQNKSTNRHDTPADTSKLSVNRLTAAQSMTELFARHLQTESLEGYRCTEGCSNVGTSVRQTSFIHLPDVLAVTINRFRHSGVGAKIRKPVLVNQYQCISLATEATSDANEGASGEAGGEAISLSDTRTSSGRVAPSTTEQESDRAFLQYALFACIVHSGESIESGHYKVIGRALPISWLPHTSAHIRTLSHTHTLPHTHTPRPAGPMLVGEEDADASDAWYMFNDASISPFSFRQLQQMCLNEVDDRHDAYMLFYKKVKPEDRRRLRRSLVLQSFASSAQLAAAGDSASDAPRGPTLSAQGPRPSAQSPMPLAHAATVLSRQGLAARVNRGRDGSLRTRDAASNQTTRCGPQCQTHTHTDPHIHTDTYTFTQKHRHSPRYRQAEDTQLSTRSDVIKFSHAIERGPATRELSFSLDQSQPLMPSSARSEMEREVGVKRQTCSDTQSLRYDDDRLRSPPDFASLDTEFLDPPFNTSSNPPFDPPFDPLCVPSCVSTQFDSHLDTQMDSHLVCQDPQINAQIGSERDVQLDTHVTQHKSNQQSVHTPSPPGAVVSIVLGSDSFLDLERCQRLSQAAHSQDAVTMASSDDNDDTRECTSNTPRLTSSQARSCHGLNPRTNSGDGRRRQARFELRDHAQLNSEKPFGRSSGRVEQDPNSMGSEKDMNEALGRGTLTSGSSLRREASSGPATPPTSPFPRATSPNTIALITPPTLTPPTLSPRLSAPTFDPYDGMEGIAIANEASPEEPSLVFDLDHLLDILQSDVVPY